MKAICIALPLLLLPRISHAQNISLHFCSMLFEATPPKNPFQFYGLIQPHLYFNTKEVDNSLFVEVLADHEKLLFMHEMKLLEDKRIGTLHIRRFEYVEPPYTKISINIFRNDDAPSEEPTMNMYLKLNDIQGHFHIH